MKKLFSFIVLAILAIALTACGGDKDDSSDNRW